MGDTDVLTLDVVTMLFDYILDDSDVPDAMKALIGRLQIPVLKAALMDRAIFSTKTHPVRRLLDTLAGAAIGWSEANGKDDPLYQKVESIVHRILERFERDLGVFNELLSELEEFLSVEQRDAQDAAEQSAEAIEERHRLAHAWMMAGDEIRRRTDKKNMPVTVRDFLNTHWKDLLAVTHIRRGEESPQWEAALRTMDDLIWSVLPKQQAEERQKLVAALPALVRRLKSGLKVVSMPERERANFMSTVADLQAAAVRGGREFGAGDIQPKGSITPLAGRPSPVATISDSATSDATSSDSAGSESEEALPTEAPASP